MSQTPVYLVDLNKDEINFMEAYTQFQHISSFNMRPIEIQFAQQLKQKEAEHLLLVLDRVPNDIYFWDIIMDWLVQCAKNQIFLHVLKPLRFHSKVIYGMKEQFQSVISPDLRPFILTLAHLFLSGIIEESNYSFYMRLDDKNERHKGLINANALANISNIINDPYFKYYKQLALEGVRVHQREHLPIQLVLIPGGSASRANFDMLLFAKFMNTNFRVNAFLKSHRYLTSDEPLVIVLPASSLKTDLCSWEPYFKSETPGITHWAMGRDNVSVTDAVRFENTEILNWVSSIKSLALDFTTTKVAFVVAFDVFLADRFDYIEKKLKHAFPHNVDVFWYTNPHQEYMSSIDPFPMYNSNTYKDSLKSFHNLLWFLYPQQEYQQTNRLLIEPPKYSELFKEMNKPDHITFPNKLYDVDVFFIENDEETTCANKTIFMKVLSKFKDIRLNVLDDEKIMDQPSSNDTLLIVVPNSWCGHKIYHLGELNLKATRLMQGYPFYPDTITNHYKKIATVTITCLDKKFVEDEVGEFLRNTFGIRFEDFIFTNTIEQYINGEVKPVESFGVERKNKENEKEYERLRKFLDQ